MVLGWLGTRWLAGFWHEHGQRITETLRVTFGHWQPVRGQNRGTETGGKESGNRAGLAMGICGPVPGVRMWMLDPRPRAGADVAALGHDAIHHVDPGADTTGELPGAWGQDDDRAVGGPARTVHSAL